MELLDPSLSRRKGTYFIFILQSPKIKLECCHVYPVDPPYWAAGHGPRDLPVR